MRSCCERLVNKPSVVQPPLTRHSLCCQCSGGRAGLVQLHMFQACSGASLPPFPFPFTCAQLCENERGGPIVCTGHAFDQSGEFPHPASFPLGFVAPSHHL